MRLFTFSVSDFEQFWQLLNHKILHFLILHYSKKIKKLIHHHHWNSTANLQAFHFNTSAIIDLGSYFKIRYCYLYFNFLQLTSEYYSKYFKNCELHSIAKEICIILSDLYILMLIFIQISPDFFHSFFIKID